MLVGGAMRWDTGGGCLQLVVLLIILAVVLAKFAACIDNYGACPL